MQKRTRHQEPEIADGHIILHRSPNFYVRTTNRHGQRPHPLRRRTGHTVLVPKVVPEQEKRIAASNTRLMPNVTPINPLQTGRFPLPIWAEAILVVLGLLAALITHAFNIFNFPSYELDEGTYMASAWAVLHGMITPYSYGYGHPPVGWIQIAAWIQFTGGFFTFGNAINTGRVLMLLYTLGSALLVYLIIRRLEGSRSAALFAMSLFSLSPISVIYQRQIFLDNIGTFWLLLSLYFLVISDSRLRYITFAALSFGIALLSKEIFVLFIPVMLYALWLHTTPFQRKFAFVAFAYTIIAMGSSFVLLAILKGELLPTGILPWDHHPHLSLLDTFVQQTQRGQNEGSFATSWNQWTESDSLLIAFSILAVAFNLIAGWWNRKLLLLSLLAISFWLLLIRGGVIFPFYFIPMIPLVAFNAATAINTVMRWIARLAYSDIVRVVLLSAIMLAISSYDLQHSLSYITQSPATTQQNALIWIRNHVPQTAFIIINSYFYTDLHEPGGEGVGDGAIYPYVHIYWNVAYDPGLHDGLLKNDWNRIDYIVTDPPMLSDLQARSGPMLLIAQALNNSSLRAQFQSQDSYQHADIRIYQVNHTNTSSVVGLAPINVGSVGLIAPKNARGLTSFRGRLFGSGDAISRRGGPLWAIHFK
jgi:4-amino-4-deoxy-L-arabinose transferase-like glycosyltransferase